MVTVVFSFSNNVFKDSFDPGTFKMHDRLMENHFSPYKLRFFSLTEEQLRNTCTVIPVLETTCIKRPRALSDHFSDTATLLKLT